MSNVNYYLTIWGAQMALKFKPFRVFVWHREPCEPKRIALILNLGVKAQGQVPGNQRKLILILGVPHSFEHFSFPLTCQIKLMYYNPMTYQYQYFFPPFVLSCLFHPCAPPRLLKKTEKLLGFTFHV